MVRILIWVVYKNQTTQDSNIAYLKTNYNIIRSWLCKVSNWWLFNSFWSELHMDLEEQSVVTKKLIEVKSKVAGQPQVDPEYLRWAKRVDSIQDL